MYKIRFPMEFKRVPLSEIVPSPHNPPQRIMGSRILKLKSNIMKTLDHKSEGEGNLIQPITVAYDMTICDGHRRYQALVLAAKERGLKRSEVEVPIIKHNSSSSDVYDAMWVDANSDTMLINGAQCLWRYLQGVPIPQKYLSRIKTLEKWLGKEYADGMFRRIMNKGQSANTYQYIIGIYRAYTNKTSKAEMKKFVYYLLNVENAYRVKSSIAMFIPVDTLLNCVHQREKLLPNWYSKDKNKLG